MNWIRQLFWRRRLYSDLSAEIQGHLDEAVEDLMAKGMSREEAIYAARRMFGNVTLIEQTSRDSWRWQWIENLLLDMLYGLRTVARSPAFAAVAVVTLALGIGATTSIFSVVKAVIFAPLPFRNPQNLVHLWEGSPGTHYHRGDQAYFSSARPADLYDWRAQTQSFENISAFRYRSMLFSGAKAAELVAGQEVFDQFFEMLGAQAKLGRTLQVGDYEPSAAHVVVISNRMWVQRLGADPAVIGRRVLLDRASYEIVGVMPQNFYPTGSGYPEFWVPHWANAGERNDRTSWGLFPLARLKPGVTWQQAQTEFDVISARIAQENPTDEPLSAVVVPMDAQLIGSSWKLLLLLSSGVMLLLLIACVNVTNLLLARVLERSKEFALRTALGASRGRIALQLFTENLVLAIGAGALGFAVAFAQTRLILRQLLSEASLPRLDTVKVDISVLIFVCVISLIAGVLFSLLPILAASRTPPYDALRTEGRSMSAGVGQRRLGQVFIVSEFVFSLMLLIVGTLLIQSFMRLRHEDPGFDTTNLLTFNIPVPEVSYGKFVFGAKDIKREKLYEQLEQIINSETGVESVAFTSHLPLRHEFNGSPVLIPGREQPLGESILTDTGIQRVNPNYFRTLRLKLISGRFLEERDGPDAPLAAVVNQAFVKTFFPNEDPIGRQIGVWYAKPIIVGVVGDFKVNALDRNPLPEILWSLRQDPWRDVWVMARTRVDANQVSQQIRKSIANFDPDLPVREMNSMSVVISDSLWLKRISAVLIGLVTALAITLAGTGIYSVVSYSVSRRTKEVGIRVALGANRIDVLRLIMGEVSRLVLIGSMIGCAAAYVAGRLATNLTYLAPSVAASLAPEKMSPVAFIANSVFLCGVAFAAGLAPARRASRVDPILALRHEV